MLHCTVCFYCSMTELATCHSFLVTGQLYWVKILVPQPKPMKVQSHDFRCQRKVLSLCHPFLNMPSFFILFSSPLYYILFCAQLIVLTSVWSSSSPFSSHPLYPLYPGHPFLSLLLHPLSSPPFYLSRLLLSDSWTRSLFYGEWFPTPDTPGVGGGEWLTQAIQIFN